MSTATLALVPLGVPALPANGAAFTGSSSEYWALATAHAHDSAMAQKVEKERHRLRIRQRIFTWMYNALAVGELVYFIVGLYIVEWQVADLEDNPLLGPGTLGVIKMGGTHAQRIIQRHQYWRLLSSLFYNAGAIHLAANMGMVWAFGHFLVRELSPWVVALTFFAAGLAGIMVSVNVGGDYMTAAASIPPFALAGAATAMLLYHWRRYSCHVASAITVGFIVGINAFIGATPFVDNSGNTAGFVFGGVMCLGFMMVLKKEKYTRRGEGLVYAVAAVSMAVVVAAIVGGLVGLQEGTPVAGCCDAWVCTPSSWWDCDASRIWPTTCTFTTYLNGTAALACPKGQSVLMVAPDTTPDTDTIQLMCDTYCALAAAATGTASPTESGDMMRR